MSKIVAVDVDDVCLLLLPTWIALYNAEFDDNLDWTTIDDWNVAKFVKPEAKKRIYEYIEHEDVFLASPRIEGSLEGVHKIRSMGHRVIFVTANNPNGAKHDWLVKKGFLTDSKDFVQAYDKSLILADILFDDRYENCRDFNGYAVLKNRPYNWKFSWKLRADNWEDFVEFVKTMG